MASPEADEHADDVLTSKRLTGGPDIASRSLKEFREAAGYMVRSFSPMTHTRNCRKPSFWLIDQIRSFSESFSVCRYR